MELVRYTCEGGSLGGLHHRFIQPPQIAYFVTTCDRYGNMNTTPVTMGTCIAHNFFSFTLSNLHTNEAQWDLDKNDWQDGIKQGYANLREVPECVISYYGHDMIPESWIAGCPVPKGISEIDVMGCTPLPSEHVKPVGIRECPINLEAKVLHVHKLGKRWVNFIVEIVGATVHKSLVDENEKGRLAGYGMLAIDPVFEVMIASGNTPETQNYRLYYDRLDFDKIERCPENIGYDADWIGTFEGWIHDEVGHGHITQAEEQRALELKKLWEKDRNPQTNAAVKQELTALLRKAVGK
ncbi:MAG: hypothetical protein IKJ51_00865 [Clostridia bacterium]|nr:hypothetical protein [Clostridia bacterium]MBR6810031.1 hypothetical protein [Clostridia bacterium]